MNSTVSLRLASLAGAWRPWLPSAALALFLSLGAGAWAAPGAHGPNGEHLDAPAAAGAAAGGAGAAPRMEARSESFELVAHLRGDELSMLINRFETNEPVLGAKVEVESGTAKAAASFHEDMGDYAIDDPAFLKALQAPGAHPLVITILAGQESDLLEGTLQAGAANIPAAAAGGDGHGHARGGEPGHGIPNLVWVGLVVALLVAAGAWMIRRARKAQGGAQ